MKRSKKSLCNAILVGFLSASMVFTTPMASFAQSFENGDKVTVDSSDIRDNFVWADYGTDVTVNGSLSHNNDGNSINVMDGASVTVNGDVDGNIYADKGSATVEGDVTNGTVSGIDGTINISGNINTKYEDESSHEGLDVVNTPTKVGGDVTFDTKSGGYGVAINNISSDKPLNAEIGKNVTASSTGILKDNPDELPNTVDIIGVSVSGNNGTETNVKVGGDINVKGSMKSSGLNISADYDEGGENQDKDKAKVKINVTTGGVTVTGPTEKVDADGSYEITTSGVNITSNGNANVNLNINGDVKSTGEGIFIDAGKDTDTNVIVTGSIEADKTAVTIFKESDNSKVTLTTWKIKSGDDVTIDVTKPSEEIPDAFESDDQATNEFASNINYIIRHEGTITLDGTRTITALNGDSYETAHENEKLTIHVKVDDDKKYRVDRVEGGTATATKNADGSWTLTVPKNGGVDIRAVLVAIEQKESSSSSSSSSSGGGSSSSHPGSSNAASGMTTTTTDGATVQTNVAKNNNSTTTAATVRIGTSTANVTSSVSEQNGTKVTFQNATGNLAGASFKTVGQISADGTTLVKEDGTTAKMATGMLLAIENADGTSIGCFVDSTGKVVATGSYEVYYMLGTDGKLHAHFVNPQGYFMTGIQVINGQTVTFNAVGEMVSVQ